MVNDGPSYDAATVFTANRCQANPVLWSKEAAKDGVVRAVVLNSGGANCYTGPDGFQTTHAVAERVAGHLDIGADRRRRLLHRPDRAGQRPRRRCSPASTRRTARWARERRTGRGPRDHDHRLGPQAGRRRRGRLVGRRHGQGRRDAGAAARHHARGAHHRRRRRRGRPRHRTPGSDPGQLRPARLRRLHVDQRHRGTVHGQRRERDHPDARRPHRRGDQGLHRPRPAAARRRRGRRARDRDHRAPRGLRGRRRRGRAAASPGATSSRRPSSATTPTGDASWPASAPRGRPSTRPTSTSP